MSTPNAVIADKTVKEGNSETPDGPAEKSTSSESDDGEKSLDEIIEAYVADE